MLTPVHGKIKPRHRDDAPLLPPGNRLGWHAAAGIATRLHFNEYNRVAVGGNDVNFANSGAIAPGKNCVPPPLERLAREILAQYSEADRAHRAHGSALLQTPGRPVGRAAHLVTTFPDIMRRLPDACRVRRGGAAPPASPLSRLVPPTNGPARTCRGRRPNAVPADRIDSRRGCS